MLEKDESSLEMVMPVAMKARDHFLRIQKKIGPTLSLNMGQQSVLTITKEEPQSKRRRLR